MNIREFMVYWLIAFTIVTICGILKLLHYLRKGK